MATRRNKKALCFIDECGTPGTTPFQLGAVFVLASDAGKLDKSFSDLLPASASEVHAVRLNDRYLQGAFAAPARDASVDGVVMINKQFSQTVGDPPVLYAQALAETVKIGMRRFGRVLGRRSIDNVDVITDANAQNGHPAFAAELERAQHDDGRFRDVNGTMRIDSAASRLLKLADVVACARKWTVAEDVNAAGLRAHHGIELV